MVYPEAGHCFFLSLVKYAFKIKLPMGNDPLHLRVQTKKVCKIPMPKKGKREKGKKNWL